MHSLILYTLKSGEHMQWISTRHRTSPIWAYLTSWGLLAFIGHLWLGFVDQRTLSLFNALHYNIQGFPSLFWSVYYRRTVYKKTFFRCVQKQTYFIKLLDIYFFKENSTYISFYLHHVKSWNIIYTWVNLAIKVVEMFNAKLELHW